jgi:cystathionine beta-lyase/cystathionine gamma-synthase
VLRDIFAGPYMTLGAMISPHDAWLMIRGLRTLPVRMQRVAATTAEIAAFLRGQARVRVLHYPQDGAYPQAALTRKQLTHASGLLSIEIDTDQDGIERFCDGLERFLMAVSWGGYESLAFPIAGVRDWRGREQQSSVPVNLVRFSIGLEEPDVLIEDLRRAFGRL